MKLPRRRQIRAAAVLWTLMILVLVLIPGSYVPGQVWDYDKVGHFGLFAGFGFLWLLALRDIVPRAAAWILLTGILFGTLTEIGQEFAPGNRAGDPLDAAADTLGVVLGVLAALWLLKRSRKRDSGSASRAGRSGAPPPQEM